VAALSSTWLLSGVMKVCSWTRVGTPDHGSTTSAGSDGSILPMTLRQGVGTDSRPHSERRRLRAPNGSRRQWLAVGRPKVTLTVLLAMH
jgi:hypothetical protein